MQGFINGPKFSGVENVLEFGDLEEEKKSYMHLERRRLVSKLVRDNTSAKLAILIYENKRRIQKLEVMHSEARANGSSLSHIDILFQVEKRELLRQRNAAASPPSSLKNETSLLPQG